MIEELFEKEKQLFIEGMKVQKGLSLNKQKDLYYGLGRAFDDAFRDYARRTKQKYKDDKEKLMQPTVDIIFGYFNNEDTKFDDCFRKAIQEGKKILDNDKYGIAQKFISMSFKYLICYSDAGNYSDKFEICFIPLDKYTINWIMGLNDKSINGKLRKIEKTWSNIDEELFFEIQKKVQEELNSDIRYLVSYSLNAGDNQYCVLPRQRLKAEFIIWHQEKLNEIHSILEKNEEDFERLGIEKIKKSQPY